MASCPACLEGKTVCVVGGGNAAHAMIALFGSKNITTTWWAPFRDEAEKLQASVEAHGFIKGDFAKELKPSGDVLGKPEKNFQEPC